MPYHHRPTTVVQIAAYSLVVYDWLLCFADEIAFLSTPGVSAAKVLYVLCRYWPIITHPITLYIQRIPHGTFFCQAHSRIPLYLGVINLALAAGVLSLRLYAFTGCRRLVAGGLLAATVVVMAYQFWAVSTLFSSGPFGPRTCFLTDANKQSMEDTLFAQNLLGGYFIAPMSFDILALGIFVAHAFRTLDVQLKSFPLLTGLSRTFLQQGFIYFFAISAINLANAALSHQAPNMYGCAWLSNVCTVLSILVPNVLACRMVLGLRSAAQRPMRGTSTFANSQRIRIISTRQDSTMVVSDVGELETCDGQKDTWTQRTRVEESIAVKDATSWERSRV
ncbi:hypothetical protein BKA62DRAFT_828291 [Auriculariales sp. MPI-PUGE-AT-0066]|nr:hypothetical protein BKA62DRAFT_828291 [Auriculariales sp. MPI-PUGE-AT-0066]